MKNHFQILDLISTLNNLLSTKEGNRSKFKTVFGFLLLISIFLFAFGLTHIIDLNRPILFVSIFSFVGLLIAISIIIFLWKRDYIFKLDKELFSLIGFTCIFLSISTFGIINSELGNKKNYRISISQNELKTNKIEVYINDKKQLIPLPKNIKLTAQKQNYIVQFNKGFLGFNGISWIEK